MRLGEDRKGSEISSDGQKTHFDRDRHKARDNLYKGTKAFSLIGFVGDIYMLLAIDKTSNEIIKPGSVIRQKNRFSSMR